MPTEDQEQMWRDANWAADAVEAMLQRVIRLCALEFLRLANEVGAEPKRAA